MVFKHLLLLYRNYTVLEQNKSGVKFRNSALERHNDQQAELVRRYEEQQRSIVQEMAGLAAGYSEPLLQLGRTLSSLDVSVCTLTHLCSPRTVPRTR